MIRKILVTLILSVTLLGASFAGNVAPARAVILPYGACWGYEWGKLAQNAQGIWYRCAWTGNGPTGFQWWRL